MALTAGEDRLTGTAGNDVFNAPLVEAVDGQRQTLNSTDILDGGEGSDRLNATLNTETTAPTISNIEQLFVRSVDVASTLNMDGVSGAEQLWNDRSTSALTWNNIQEAAVLGLNEVRSDTTANFASVAEASDLTVVSNGAGTAANQVGLTVNNGGVGSISSLNLVAAAGVTNLLVAGQLAGITELTVSGAGAAMLEGEGESFAEIENVDASEHTGGLVLDITGQDDGEFLNVVLGSGDDVLRIDGAVLIGEDIATLDGGEGSDSLVVSGVFADGEGEANISALDFSNVSNFENLTLDVAFDLATDPEQVLDLSETDFTSLTFAQSLTADTLELTGSEAFDTINVAATLDNAVLVTAGFEDLTVNAGANIGSDSAITLKSDDLTTLTLVDTTSTSTVQIDVLLVDTPELTTIDLSGMTATWNPDSPAADELGFVGVSSATIDASAAAFENTVTLSIGSGTVDYTTAGDGVREIFQFVGDDISDVEITGFDNGAGNNRDRLDFSQFEGIASTEDLSITYDGETATITSDAFNGEITVQLVGDGNVLVDQDFLF